MIQNYYFIIISPKKLIIPPHKYLFIYICKCNYVKEIGELPIYNEEQTVEIYYLYVS
jgi:hypothetical protein